MSEILYVVGDDKHFGSEIRKKGLVAVERFHKELTPWFFQNHYLFNESGISSKTRSDGKEQIIEWKATRKINSYFKFHIEVRFIILRWLKEKAEATVSFKGYVETDWKHRFEKYGKFGKFLKKIYDTYLIKERVEGMKRKITAETNDFITETKTVLQLITQ